MQRIDGPFNVSTKPELSPPANSPGYFSGGDPIRGRKATRVTKDFLNWIQEEICHVIEAAEIKLDRTDDTQLLQALRVLFGISPGGQGSGGQALGGSYIGEFKNFYLPSPPAGWAVRNGGLLVGADLTVPKLWEALQKQENAWICRTQAEWNALSQTSPWNGIGGVPYFVIDINAKTVRLPDTRGMYIEDAGFDGLTVGGVHGDAIRNFTGRFFATTQGYNNGGTTGAFSHGVLGPGDTGGEVGEWLAYYFDPSRVVPTANKNQPRAFGALGCVYVGGAE